MEETASTSSSIGPKEEKHPFTIEAFLLSALAAIPEIDEESKDKVETIIKYATLLRNAKLAGEDSFILNDGSTKLGIPLGHAVYISEAAVPQGTECYFL